MLFFRPLARRRPGRREMSEGVSVQPRPTCRMPPHQPAGIAKPAVLCEGVLNTGPTKGTSVVSHGSSRRCLPAARGRPLDPGCRGTLGLSYRVVPARSRFEPAGQVIPSLVDQPPSSECTRSIERGDIRNKTFGSREPIERSDFASFLSPASIDVHGLPQSSVVCRGSRTDRPARPDPGRDRRAAGSGRDPSPGLPGGGPAILFERVRGCRFPMVSNLFGTIDRTRFLFRDTIERVKHLVRIKLDPATAGQHPWDSAWALPLAWAMQPKSVSRGPAMAHETTLDQLPQLVSWPKDGGPFVTLPAVYTEDPDAPGWRKSNLGMYRIQMAGNEYAPNRQVGLHYQIHRTIGVHHAKAIRRGEPFRVNVFIGGPPVLPVAAVMPLPEGLSELTFAGALGGHRIPLIRRRDGLPIIAEADFCISGTVDPRTLPEGPFGDHLGYYSLAHPFPVMNVDKVYHRPGAIWPFTVVGRPPQEDTAFGEIIHEITGPAIPEVLLGIQAVHAVDAAGVHPLLLAIGSERYVPYAEERTPQELLTQGNAILGQGQLSLAKYLFIVAREDNPGLDIHDIAAFLEHVLERIDPERDLHFQTRTTIDTLDYSAATA